MRKQITKAQSWPYSVIFNILGIVFTWLGLMLQMMGMMTPFWEQVPPEYQDSGYHAGLFTTCLGRDCRYEESVRNKADFQVVQVTHVIGVSAGIVHFVMTSVKACRRRSSSSGFEPPYYVSICFSFAGASLVLFSALLYCSVEFDSQVYDLGISFYLSVLGSLVMLAGMCCMLLESISLRV